jgi:hypothetical protein
MTPEQIQYVDENYKIVGIVTTRNAMFYLMDSTRNFSPSAPYKLIEWNFTHNLCVVESNNIPTKTTNILNFDIIDELIVLPKN